VVLVPLMEVKEEEISPPPSAVDDCVELELGRGSFGLVYRGRFDNEERAIKVLNRITDARSLFEFRTEVRLMVSLNSEYVVRGYGAVTKSGFPTIIMELCSQGPLKKLISRLTNNQKLYAIRCIAGGLKYFHSRMLAHRDLKTENIYVDHHGDVKIGDFGLVKMIGGTKTKGNAVVGTPCNMAPEVARGECSGAEWIQADMWALGMVIAELFDLEVVPGLANLAQDDQIQKLKELKENQYRIPNLPADVPAALQPLFARCLSINPKGRPTAKEVFDALAAVSKAFLVAIQTSPSNKEAEARAEEERKSRLEAEARHKKEVAELQSKLAAASKGKCVSLCTLSLVMSSSFILFCCSCSAINQQGS